MMRFLDESDQSARRFPQRNRRPGPRIRLAKAATDGLIGVPVALGWGEARRRVRPVPCLRANDVGGTVPDQGWIKMAIAQSRKVELNEIPVVDLGLLQGGRSDVARLGGELREACESV